MSSGTRQRFLSNQDWFSYLKTLGPKATGSALQKLRFDTYKDIQKLRGRPLLVYTASLLERLPPEAPINLELMDVDGFTDIINKVKSSTKSDSVDVILHSPGGSPDAAERIVDLLRTNFKEVHFLIPHSAYSAATMIALSGDSILLHPSATLGPIDPQVKGVPAKSIKKGFANLEEHIKKEGSKALPPYLPLIDKYSLELLELCDDAEKLSKSLVTSWLSTGMMKGLHHAKVKKVVNYFSDYENHLIHSRPLTYSKIKDFEIEVGIADKKLAELLWEAHVIWSGFFLVTDFIKLYETPYGVSWGRQFIPVNNNPRNTGKKPVKTK